jgi:tetratricopeptide (TPR) repeat protein
MSPRKKALRSPMPPVRKTDRRWRVPPPLTHGPEPLESGAVLEEAPGALGVLLWQSLRDVMLWTGTATAERAGLFAAGAEARQRAMVEQVGSPPALEGPLLALGSLLGAPEAARDAMVADACRRIAEWAGGEGLLALALSYSQAVALVLTDDAQAAYTVGLLARRRAEYARAETWFRRAIMLARQSGDWSSYCLAFIGLGKLYVQRGNFPTARKLHLRARRAARRHSLRHLEAMALHDLFVVAANTHEAAEAEAFAGAALEAYGPRHFRLPALAHDVAYFWLENGYFARALPVFQAVLPHFGRQADRVRVFADIARAAAGAGEEALFEGAWEEAVALAERPDAVEGTAQGLLDLAHGAAMLQQWGRAQEAATRALRLAGERNEAKVRLEAVAVLDSVRRRSGTVAVRTAAAPQSPRGDALASELVEHLSAGIAD